MTSAPVRDPLADHLITPQNAAFLLIDYQPSQRPGSARWIARSVVGSGLSSWSPASGRDAMPASRGVS